MRCQPGMTSFGLSTLITLIQACFLFTPGYSARLPSQVGLFLRAIMVILQYDIYGNNLLITKVKLIAPPT
jgi:hypothetical protein